MRVPQNQKCSRQGQISEEFSLTFTTGNNLISYLVDLGHGSGLGVNILPGLGVLLTEVLL